MRRTISSVSSAGTFTETGTITASSDRIASDSAMYPAEFSTSTPTRKSRSIPKARSRAAVASTSLNSP